MPHIYISEHVWTLNVSVLCLQEEEERGKRQVLVLGLDGAGKSSMLQGLTPGEPAAKKGVCRPTHGFNFMSLNAPACQLDFLESKSPFPSNSSTADCVRCGDHLCFSRSAEILCLLCSFQSAICFIELA